MFTRDRTWYQSLYQSALPISAASDLPMSTNPYQWAAVRRDSLPQRCGTRRAVDRCLAMRRATELGKRVISFFHFIVRYCRSLDCLGNGKQRRHRACRSPVARGRADACGLLHEKSEGRVSRRATTSSRASCKYLLSDNDHARGALPPSATTAASGHWHRPASRRSGRRTTTYTSPRASSLSGTCCLRSTSGPTARRWATRRRKRRADGLHRRPAGQQLQGQGLPCCRLP